LYLAALALGIGGCTSFNYAQNVKLISFDDNIKKGSSAGTIRGEDCTWHVLGYNPNGLPTVDKAFINAKNQAGSADTAGFNYSGKNRGQALRYVNNVIAENKGFNVGLFGKQCIVVKGVGYR